MLQSIIYKEWLKIRWAIIGSAALLLLAVVNVFLTVRHDILASGAASYWYNVLFYNINYFSMLKFMPAIAGIIVAAFQYAPEIIEKRIKLSFHLPMKENQMLLKMHLFGTTCLVLVFLLFFASFSLLNSVFFPSEITVSAIQTIIPWILGGLCSFFLASLIILEPLWKYKVVYALVSFAYVLIYFERGVMSAFAGINGLLAVITVGLSVVLIFSGHRFRKGEM